MSLKAQNNNTFGTTEVKTNNNDVEIYHVQYLSREECLFFPVESIYLQVYIKAFVTRSFISLVFLNSQLTVFTQSFCPDTNLAERHHETDSHSLWS